MIFDLTEGKALTDKCADRATLCNMRNNRLIESKCLVTCNRPSTAHVFYSLVSSSHPALSCDTLGRELRVIVLTFDLTSADNRAIITLVINQLCRQHCYPTDRCTFDKFSVQLSSGQSQADQNLGEFFFTSAID